MADLTINGTAAASPAASSADTDTQQLPRPVRTLRATRLTYADVVDHLLLSDNIRASETKALNRVKRAVLAANDGFASYSDAGFKNYYVQRRLLAGGAVTLPSISVDANKVVTVTGATLPTWLKYAHLKIDRDHYPVTVDPGTGTSFTIGEADELAAGTYTTASLEQMFLPLPLDFRRRGSITEGRNRYPISDTHASTLIGWRDFYNWSRASASARVFGSITTDVRFQGGFMLAMWPAFNEDTVIVLFYERYPRPLLNHRVFNGAGTITASGSTVTSTNSVFLDKHLGSIIVAAADNATDIQTAGADPDLGVESRVITEVTSATGVEVDSEWTLGSARSYYITDPVDVLSGPQEQAFIRLAEWELSRQMHSKQTPEKRQEFERAMLLAMSDDARYSGPAGSKGEEWVGSTQGDVDARPA